MEAVARMRTASASWAWTIYPVAVFAASRVAIWFVTHWSLTLDTKLHRPGGPLEFPGVEGLCRWDCAWFSSIATQGYLQQHWTNFFPLFPLLGRGVHEVTGVPVPISLVLVANLASLGAFLVIYRLFEELEGTAVARAGLALMAAWPFAFFQAAGYPESLMSLTTAGALLLAVRGRHVLAGVVLGIGTLGRHLTLVAFPALVVEQLRQRGSSVRQLLWNPAVLGLLMPAVVVSLYLAYQQWRFGDAFSFLSARSRGWGESAWYGLYQYFTTNVAPVIHSYVLLAVVPTAGAFALLRHRRWWTLAAFGVTLMVVLLGIGLMGLGRYTGSCWPAFLPMAVAVTRYPWLRSPLLIAFAMVQGLYLYLHVHNFPIN